MEKTRKRPVLVGLSGGLDSLVAAYLMKIQKIDLYAVLIASTPEVFQDSGEDIFACHQTDSRVESVKKICDHLQIPLTVVRARDEFHAEVLESWLSSKVELTQPRSCMDCHKLRLKILYQKMKELGCEGIVTGHYAKIIRQSPGSPVSIHSSNDIAHDQSHLLVTLEQEILKKIILPLSDLQKKEVHKIADSFELRPPPRKLSFSQCLPVSPLVNDWAAKMIPASLLGEGDIVLNDQVVGQHLGFHTLEFGQDFKSSLKANDLPHKIVGCQWSENKVVLGSATHFVDKGAFLNLCDWGADLGLGKPLKGFIHGGLGVNREVYVFPKNLRAALVELVEGEMPFHQGQSLSVFNRKGKNAKLLVSGTIQAPFKNYPENTLSLEIRGERESESVIVDKDFNF